jgi:hypothetical protein
MTDAYPHRGAPGHAEAQVPFLGSWVCRTGGGGVMTWFVTAIISF